MESWQILIMRPKVLHIFSGYGGGISSLILNLLDNSYQQIDYTLLCFSYNGGDSFVSHMNSIGVKCLTMPRLRKEGPIKLMTYINRLLKQNKFDVIHCHIDGRAMLIFGLLAKLNDNRIFIVHAHKTKYEKTIDNSKLGHWVNKKINYLLSTHYMSCSNMAASFLFGNEYLAKRPTIHIPNGIDQVKFSALIGNEEHISRIREEFSFSEQDIILINIGRFNIQKNHIFMIELMKKLLIRNHHFKLLLVGSGELQKNIEEYCQSIGIKNNVIFAGRRQDVPLLMNFADLFILPSLWEGLPTVSVEVQATGTPIFMADTITTQCDMGLGLTTFIPLDVDIWADTIMTFSKSIKKKNPVDCIEKIIRNGYTSESAGNFYADTLYRIINENEK